MNSSRRIACIVGLQLAALLPHSGCSLILDSDATQCGSHGDCVHFPRTQCDLEHRVCVPTPMPPQDGGAATEVAAPDALVSCQAASGCFQCTPTSDLEFQGACSDATCIPFDNKRLTNINLDGTLKDLP